MKNFDIQEVVATYGIKNIRVFGEGTVTASKFPYVSIPHQMVEYCLVEHKYALRENYKLTLRPTKNTAMCSEGIQNTENLYIGDFNSLVKDGIYRVYVLDADGYTLVSPPHHAVLEEADPGTFARFCDYIYKLLKGR
jgi:hypothetical protein